MRYEGKEYDCVAVDIGNSIEEGRVYQWRYSIYENPNSMLVKEIGITEMGVMVTCENGHIHMYAGMIYHAEFEERKADETA